MHIKSLLAAIAYKSLTTFAAPLGAAFISYKKRRDPPYGMRVLELLGLYRQKSEGCIWFHGASVGEVMALKPLITAFKKAHPKEDIVLTTMTTTGANAGASLKGVKIVFSPLDSPLGVASFFHRFKPKALIIFETELWPNMLAKDHKNKIPVLVVNARMQEKNLRSYLKHKTIVKDLIASNITEVVSISIKDMKRFEKIGVENTSVSGNIKYDLSPRDKLFSDTRTIKNKYIKGKVFGAISIHDGEEKLIIDAYLKAKQEISDLKLVFVARHHNTTVLAQNYLNSLNIRYQKRSATEDISKFKADILLGDTMGEIELYFGLCDLVLMGGSFDNTGGHNPLEPAYFSLAILTGPVYHNFKDTYDRMIETGGAFLADSQENLVRYIVKLCRDEILLEETGVRALDVQQQGKGALDYTLERIDANVYGDKKSRSRKIAPNRHLKKQPYMVGHHKKK